MLYRNLILSGGYLFNLILYVLCLKGINYFFKIDNLVFSCLIFGQYFPVNLIYFLYEKKAINNINVINGILDYIQLILFYVGINNLNVAEYLSYRTMSIIFNVLLSFYYLGKKFSFIELFGFGIILLICIILLILGGINNLLYSLILLSGSFIYSLSGFLIEKYKESSDFIQIKLVSSFFSLMTYTYYSLAISEITYYFYLPKSLILIGLTGFVGFSEYMYYYLKSEIIKNMENGSVYTNVLDIIRRVIIFGLSIMIFKETYQSYMYVCYSILMLGCILYNFAKYLNQFYDYIKRKLVGYYYFDNSIELTNLEQGNMPN